jgi:hypothetical protein
MQVQETDRRARPAQSTIQGKSGVGLLPFLAFCALPACVLAILWNQLPDPAISALGPWLRWLLAGGGGLGAFLLARALWPRQAIWESLSISLIGVAAGFIGMAYFQVVSTYPFKFSWSEGNRFYDYSLVFGKALYQADKPPEMLYNEPGRYALWGALFLVRGLPIWFHRLWNALLFTVPLLLTGLLLARFAFRQPVHRWHFALWAFLFMIQGPIYPSLVVSALLVLISAGWKTSEDLAGFGKPPAMKGALPHSDSQPIGGLGKPARSILALKLLVVFLAGYYVGLSRWTWLAAPGVWAGLLVFLWDEHDPQGERLWKWLPVRKRTLAEAVLLGAAGLLGGVLAKPGLLLAPGQATGFALQQPLLLYRLFPNATYGPGILLALALAAGPPALWLAWLVLSRSWRLSWLQAAAAALPALAFLSMGTVASTKIGGGSNLHNLDMFLITLAILSALAARALVQKKLPLWGVAAHPVIRLLIQGSMALAVLVPAWNAVASPAPVRLPPGQTVQEALHTIQAEVNQAQAQGEVLFMDHRQLLTFGYIQNVRLVHEYEMKYMMDQSMAGDPSRFQQFYADLARQRFKLIVIHPLHLQYQGKEHNFGEENDAWVKWVAEAILCSYRPKVSIREVNVQLLEPRPSPKKNCP